MLELATQKSWKNFFFSLLLWYAGITFISLTNPTHPVQLQEWYAYYTMYAWPNFLFTYVLAIWVVPVNLHLKTLPRLTGYIGIALLVFIGVRYLNNQFWDSAYYTAFDTQDRAFKLSPWRIAGMELIKGIQFGALAFAYRLLLDKLLAERNQLSLEKSMLRAELNSLRYQLNPHFLFNAINNIYYLALTRSEHTTKAIIKLSELLRYLTDQKAEWVVLREELSHIRNLIAFEQIRFPDQIIREELRVDEASMFIRIPPLILTTFIENAFKHGGQGTAARPIGIYLEVNPEKLIYHVSNPISLQPLPAKDRAGTGLDTLAKRLGLLYPGRHNFLVQQQDTMFTATLELYF